MELVSFVIPVFNSSEFLRRCLDSLQNQSYPEWEAVCVNDGSTDNSLELLKEYSARDSRIRVIDKENEGVSVARNEALALIKGKYVVFVDSDDFLHPQTLEICVNAAERDGSDLVAYTYNRAFRIKQLIRHFLGLGEIEKFKFKHYAPENLEYLKTDNIFDWVTEYSDGQVPGGEKRWAVKHCQPWRCLYRREILKGISFIKGIIYEDFPWWGEVLLNVKRATILNLPLYYYYPNKRSYIMSSSQDKRIESLKIAIAEAEKIYEKCEDKEKLRAWEERFLKPFRAKLEKKKSFS